MEELTAEYWRDGPVFRGRIREMPEVVAEGQCLGELLARLGERATEVLETRSGARDLTRIHGWVTSWPVRALA